MTVTELKTELDNYGDHLEVLVDDNSTMHLVNIARVRTGPSEDGMASVILDLE